GFFTDVLGLEPQVDVRRHSQGRADLVTLRLDFGEARSGREVRHAHAVAADVVRTRRARDADALAEVGQTGVAAFRIPEGHARVHREAARVPAEAGERGAAVEVGDVR